MGRLTASATLDALRRGRRCVERVSESAYDLVVIGGGITGAGIARDAALRGLKVALFEKGDYASGTSSKSSKLIHGGLRYLEHGEIGLVFESVSRAPGADRASRRTSCARCRS